MTGTNEGNKEWMRHWEQEAELAAWFLFFIPFPHREALRAIANEQRQKVPIE
jgi:hypothetical protein